MKRSVAFLGLTCFASLSFDVSAACSEDRGLALTFGDEINKLIGMVEIDEISTTMILLVFTNTIPRR
jgi:hypothetical protein